MQGRSSLGNEWGAHSFHRSCSADAVWPLSRTEIGGGGHALGGGGREREKEKYSESRECEWAAAAGTGAAAGFFCFAV
jgi:hypothetical protein